MKKAELFPGWLLVRGNYPPVDGPFSPPNILLLENPVGMRRAAACI
ncbi:MAG: hypothetical protein ACPL7J_01410 [Desulfomonilaceae bacterium]